jgi:hypothetical protein
LRLSIDRANAVLTWLADHGIDAQRLVPHGYGLTQPLVPNDTEPHRQRNRRVQFRMLEQQAGSAPLGPQPSTTLPGANSPSALPPAPPAPGAPPPSAAPPGAPRPPASKP